MRSMLLCIVYLFTPLMRGSQLGATACALHHTWMMPAAAPRYALIAAMPSVHLGSCQRRRGP